METNVNLMKWKRAFYPALILGVFITVMTAAPAGLWAAGDNAVANGDFESGTTGWTCKGCSLTTGAPAQAGSAAQLTTTNRRAPAQLLQSNISLQPNTTYELSFWARSADGANVRVTLMQQSAPRANYGLEDQSFDLTSTGQVYTHVFTTTGFSQPVSDARLRFQTDKGKGHQYSLDNVTLTPLDGPPPPPPPGDELADEILVFNRGSLASPFIVTKQMSGFIEDKPPTGAANANWVTGQYAGFAGGTLYYRARIVSIPANQPGMKLGFCFWEQKYEHEQCRGQVIDGIPGTQMEWQHELSDMWVKAQPVNWANPRTKHGFLVRNENNKLVSDKKGWNWNGENPDHWYPMQIHYTVVLVKAGGTFDGWENHGW
jgi:hypothetical protein